MHYNFLIAVCVIMLLNIVCNVVIFDVVKVYIVDKFHLKKFKKHDEIRDELREYITNLKITDNGTISLGYYYFEHMDYYFQNKNEIYFIVEDIEDGVNLYASENYEKLVYGRFKGRGYSDEEIQREVDKYMVIQHEVDIQVPPYNMFKSKIEIKSKGELEMAKDLLRDYIQAFYIYRKNMVNA